MSWNFTKHEKLEQVANILIWTFIYPHLFYHKQRLHTKLGLSIGISVNINTVFVQKFLHIYQVFSAKALFLLKLAKSSSNKCEMPKPSCEIWLHNQGPFKAACCPKIAKQLFWES
jgi:hypothetical protein